MTVSSVVGGVGLGTREARKFLYLGVGRARVANQPRRAEVGPPERGEASDGAGPFGRGSRGAGWSTLGGEIRLRAALSVCGRALKAFIEREKVPGVHPASARRTLTSGEHPRSVGGRKRYPSPRELRSVTFPRPPVDVDHPPSDFDELIEWFELVSYNLVLLTDYRLDQVRRAIAAMDTGISVHLAHAGPLEVLVPNGTHVESALELVLASDHVWFQSSREQLAWSLRIVEVDDHGGNRQALGQYGRVLTEALRRHRRDERQRLAGPNLAPRHRAPRPTAAGQA
jgi:hypothetical protein